MTLCDAGPLVALFDTKQGELRDRAKSAILGLAPPLVTTWPCLTEAMHFLGKIGGWSRQNLLWRMVIEQSLILHDLTGGEAVRAFDLMRNYRDLPMDLADATLIATAESLQLDCILTFDKDFFVYRLADGRSLEVLL